MVKALAIIILAEKAKIVVETMVAKVVVICMPTNIRSQIKCNTRLKCKMLDWHTALFRYLHLVKVCKGCHPNQKSPWLASNPPVEAYSKWLTK